MASSLGPTILQADGRNPVPTVNTASRISEFENKMQLSINPVFHTAGQIPRPECLFSDLFATVMMENTSTFSPSGARGGAANLLSRAAQQQLDGRGGTDSLYSHMADTSNKTEGGVIGASDLATDAMTITTRNGDSRIVASHGGRQRGDSHIVASAEHKGRSGGGGGGGGSGNESEDASKQRKRRTRSKEQLDQNRIAQQKYRDRKRNEASELQNALDQMAVQLSAYKVLEGRMNEMDATNQGLQQVVIQQMQRIRQLEGQVEHQSSAMASQLADLKDAVAIATRQDGMINEQQGKLHMQEQALHQMRERLQAGQHSALSGSTFENSGANFGGGGGGANGLGFNSGGGGCGGGGNSTSMKVLEVVQGAVHGLLGSHAAAQAAQRMSPDDLVIAISQQILSACQEGRPNDLKHELDFP